jgi:sulfate permease, SulP family
VPKTPSVGAWLASVRPRRADAKADILAGLPGAISSVPDGMASSVLVGVNPVHGLYASFAGPIAGGLTSSTRLMVITTTTAAALAAGSALGGVDPADRGGALVLLTLLAGAVLVVAAIARIGRYIRFVSHSVMLGFLTGVSVNIVLGQLPDLLGVDASGDVSLTKAIDAVTHPGDVVLPTLVTGLAALGLLFGLARSSLALFSSVIALIIPTAGVIVFSADRVARVSDVGDIPNGLPLPGLPSLSALTPGVVTGALAVAAIVLVQGAGVADSSPNPDKSRSVADQDIAAQGFGNLAAGVFGGQPVGGSVGQTALNVAAGARTRWAGIWSGIWMLIILVALSRVVSLVALPTLAAVLVFAAIGSFKPTEIITILHSGRTAQIAFITTFAATLFLPVAAAVGIGVALSLLLQLNQEAIDLRLVRLVPDESGRFTEADAPARLADDDVVVLDVYGSLFYAGARTLQLRLPDPGNARRPAVVLRMRGRTTLGATFFAVVGDYARRLADAGGRLYLTGLDPTIADRWEKEGLPERAGSVRLYRATPAIGASTYDAFLRAQDRILGLQLTDGEEEAGEVGDDEAGDHEVGDSES